jgi:response regulator RpfG family c-di-GMP phosphodiesterase
VNGDHPWSGFRTVLPGESGSSSPEESDRHVLHVLVVDDDIPTLDFLVDAFAANGCLPSRASNAEQALGLLSGQPFNLVVADIMLPGLSGLDLLRVVRGTRPQTPVVLITGLPSVNSAVFGLRYGAYDYLSKPFSIAEVQRLLQHLRTDLDRNGSDRAAAGLGEELVRRERGMEGLFRIGALALQDVAPSVFVETVLDYALSGLRSDAALLVLGDEDGQLTHTGRGRPALVSRLSSLCGASVERLASRGAMEPLTMTGPEHSIAAAATLVPVAGNVMGILCLGRERQRGTFLPDEHELLRAYAQVIALGLQKIDLRDEPESDPVEFMSVFVAALESLESKTPYLRGHSARVSLYAGEIATSLGLSRTQVAVIRRAGLLHDLGKLVLPDTILLKPDRLTPEEYALIQRHPTIGSRILRRLPVFTEEAAAIEHQLERYDGAGYPGGLKGGAIPLPARILRVADAFDAMTSPRPYRPALSPEAALAELDSGAGVQFDPTVIQAFASIPRPRLAEIGRYYGSRSRCEASGPDLGESGPSSTVDPSRHPSETPADSPIGTAVAGADQRNGQPPQPSAEGACLAGAREHWDLIEELKRALGEETESLRVIEDRLADPAILPRDGREGGPLDQVIDP